MFAVILYHHVGEANIQGQLKSCGIYDVSFGTERVKARSYAHGTFNVQSSLVLYRN
jgi:hypothetical protein